jgi:hypothetical protein
LTLTPILESDNLSSVKTEMLTIDDVLAQIEVAVEAAGSAKALADKWGVVQSYLSDVRAKRRLPGPSIVACLGLRSEQVYWPVEKSA